MNHGELVIPDPNVRLLFPNDPHLRSFGYHYHQEILEIEFRTGEVYQYTGVPMYIPFGLIKAEDRKRFVRGYLYKTFFSRRVPVGLELFQRPE
ncbi:MAG: KTSC domain-containing protein [Candidatus Eremiobacterota bacterium]